jgi:hypothetical protein
MSLSQRIEERRQVDIQPMRERRGTPVWIRRMTERQLDGKDGFTVRDNTHDVLKEVA